MILYTYTMNSDINSAQNINHLSPEEFPPLLRHIHRPPKHMYIRGKALWLDPAYAHHTYICVVGARVYTEYGKEACRHLIAGLADYKVVIVSGLAIGIDGIAHQAALDAGIPTIALPGSGLNWSVLYPARHFRLAKDIIGAGAGEGARDHAPGALLSEYQPDMPAAPWTFPCRNRLMAGMSHATIVVEAEEKSGALITARHALEFGRETYAVPGSIFSFASVGTNKILGEWARPITTVEAFVEEMKIEGNIQENRDTHACASPFE